ncbi:hypothetical protein ACLRGF_01255 [Mycetocola zhadangensis]|uniref:hypothetical protein n=1 Tax=Mycetocola zhadangensis TaxID=1164595 RepID=UPI003A4E0152
MSAEETELLPAALPAGRAINADPDASSKTYSVDPLVSEPEKASPTPTASNATPEPLRPPKLPPRRFNSMPSRVDVNKTLTISVAALAVVSLVVAGFLLWSKNQAPSVEQSMFASYQTQQAELGKLATTAAADVAAFTTLRDELSALNANAATALAAVAGFSDEPSRLAAETARIEFESSIAAQAPVTPSDDPVKVDGKLSEKSSVDELASGINALNAEAQRLEEDADVAASALAKLTATRNTFVAAMGVFGATIPATATDVINRNPDAAASFEDAVTSAVASLTAAIDAGQPGIAEVQAYASAAAALQAEHARLGGIGTSEPDNGTGTTPRTTPRTPPRTSTPPTSTVPSPPAGETPVAPVPVVPTPPVDEGPTPEDPVE